MLTATSLSIAEAMSEELDDASVGILVGAPHFQLFERSFLDSVHLCYPTVDRGMILDGGYSYRSVYVPSRQQYRVGETVLLLEQVVVVSGIYSVQLGSEHRHLIEGKVYRQMPSPGLQMLHVVISTQDKVVAPVCTIKRKVMLYQHPAAIASHSQHYEVIDYQRPSLPVSAQDIVVPYFPECGDMVWVAGNSDGHSRNEQWLGHVISVDSDSQTVKMYFFVEQPSKAGCYIRETSTRNTVHWSSLIGRAEGHWERDKWMAVY